MKKHNSVIMFLVRNKIYKITLVLLAMLAAGICGFQFLGYKDALHFGLDYGDRFLGIVFLIGYLLSIVSIIDLPASKSQSIYTYQRLGISERAVFAWDCIINIVIFSMLYSILISIIYINAFIYQNAPSYVQGPQGIIAVLYDNRLFHGIVPLTETGIWIRNVIFIISAGIESACLSINLRHKKNRVILSLIILMMIAIRVPVMTGYETYFWVAAVAFGCIYDAYASYRDSHNGKRRALDE